MLAKEPTKQVACSKHVTEFESSSLSLSSSRPKDNRRLNDGTSDLKLEARSSKLEVWAMKGEGSVKLRGLLLRLDNRNEPQL